jgi:hypothetical protein
VTIHLEDKKWTSIAEQVSQEMDPAKLGVLVDQLCRALDDRRGQMTREPQIDYDKRLGSEKRPIQVTAS